MGPALTSFDTHMLSSPPPHLHALSTTTRARGPHCSRQASLGDLEAFDPTLALQLHMVLACPDAGQLDLSFEGLPETVLAAAVPPGEGVPEGGSEAVAVTNANRRVYVEAVIEHALTGVRASQLDAIRRGFFTLPLQPVFERRSAFEAMVLCTGATDVIPDDFSFLFMNASSEAATTVAQLVAHLSSLPALGRQRVLAYLTGRPNIGWVRCVCGCLLGGLVLLFSCFFFFLI